MATCNWTNLFGFSEYDGRCSYFGSETALPQGARRAGRQTAACLAFARPRAHRPPLPASPPPAGLGWFIGKAMAGPAQPQGGPLAHCAPDPLALHRLCPAVVGLGAAFSICTTALVWVDDKVNGEQGAKVVQALSTAGPWATCQPSCLAQQPAAKLFRRPAAPQLQGLSCIGPARTLLGRSEPQPLQQPGCAPERHAWAWQHTQALPLTLC